MGIWFAVSVALVAAIQWLRYRRKWKKAEMQISGLLRTLENSKILLGDARTSKDGWRSDFYTLKEEKEKLVSERDAAKSTAENLLKLVEEEREARHRMNIEIMDFLQSRLGTVRPPKPGEMVYVMNKAGKLTSAGIVLPAQE